MMMKDKETIVKINEVYQINKKFYDKTISLVFLILAYLNPRNDTKTRNCNLSGNSWFSAFRDPVITRADAVIALSSSSTNHSWFSIVTALTFQTN